MKRPAHVWTICMFYLLSAGWTLLSHSLIHFGLIPLNEAQEGYFRSLTTFDYGSTIVIAASNLIGAVLLFRLRKEAFHFFVVGLIASLAVTGYQIVAKNWLGSIGTPGLVGVVFGWGSSVAIIVYSRRLTTGARRGGQTPSVT
jgi:hypothetical protein